MTENRPPLGLMPEWRHKELRLRQIREAIQRYLDAGQPIPINWVAEEYGLRNWLENRDDKPIPQPAAEPKGKEWEIVKYAYNYGESQIRHLFSSEKEFLETVGHIYAVRRLSDNEVFAVGQKVFNREGEGVDWGERQSTIMGFSLMDYGCGMFVKLYSDGETSPNGDFVRELCDIKAAPARTPLFTTTDGKPVYEGETFWYVAPDMYLGSFLSDGSKLIEGHKTFSTKAAAEQWIAENKPLYSLNDLLAALPDEESKEGVARILRLNKQPKQ